MVRVLVLSVAMLLASLAQPSAQERPSDNVRQRAANQNQKQDKYWDGFYLRSIGDCKGAIKALSPLANLGHGYEDAQLAMGQCMIELSGVAEDANMPSTSDQERQAYFAKPLFQNGLNWVNKAANAGSFTAQAYLIRLHLINLAPTQNPIEAAKWAHLYLKNPARLSLGAPVQAQADIMQLEKSLRLRDWLAGQNIAREWVPVFRKQPHLQTGSQTKRNPNFIPIGDHQ